MVTASLLLMMKNCLRSEYLEMKNQTHGISVAFFQDGNGYIDEQELDALLRDLYQSNKKVRGALHPLRAVHQFILAGVEGEL